MNESIINEYFNWLYSIIEDKQHSRKKVSYLKLLMALHMREYYYTIELDENRAVDGVQLRGRFIRESHLKPNSLMALEGPCSVLEMLVAMSLRAEEELMGTEEKGIRPGRWFWTMIENMGLIDMTDAKFDKPYTERCVNIMLDREYESNGEGGLFVVNRGNFDARKADIWRQMQLYFTDLIHKKQYSWEV